MARNVHSLLHVSFPIETFSIKFLMRDRKLQFAVTRLQFHVAWISNFSKASIRRIKKALRAFKRKAVQFLVAKRLAVNHLPLAALSAFQTCTAKRPQDRGHVTFLGLRFTVFHEKPVAKGL